MKIALVAAMAGITLCGVGCDEKKPVTPAPKTATPAPVKPTPAPTGAPTGSTGALGAAKEGVAAAASSTSAATIELRDKAVAAFSSKYDDFKMQISTLQDKAKDVPAVAKGAFDAAMTQLNAMTKDVEAKLVELKNASGETVKSLQDSIDGMWPKIQDQVTAAEKLLKGF